MVDEACEHYLDMRFSTMMLICLAWSPFWLCGDGAKGGGGRRSGVLVAADCILLVRRASTGARAYFQSCLRITFGIEQRN